MLQKKKDEKVNLVHFLSKEKEKSETLNKCDCKEKWNNNTGKKSLNTISVWQITH